MRYANQTHILLPSRVSNVSSMVSQWSLGKCSEALQKRFTDPEIKMEELTAIIKQFIEYVVEFIAHFTHGMKLKTALLCYYCY